MNNRSSDIAIFSEACRDLYAPGLRADVFTSRGFTFLRRLVSAEFVACGTLELQSQQLSIGFDTHHNSFAPAMEALGRLMQKYPLYQWDPTVNEGRPFCRSQFFSDRQFRDLDLYHEVYRLLGIDNHCALHVPTQPGEVLFFGLERDGGPDFLPEELEMLQLAQSQLSNAHSLACLFDQSAEERVDPAMLTQAGLTPREAEVLQWMNCGKSNGEIALLLKASVYTIKDHVTAIFNKAGVCNRLAAVVWARQTCHRLKFTPEKTTFFIHVPAKSD